MSDPLGNVLAVVAIPLRAEVERDGSSLVVRWDFGGDDNLEVGVGKTPEPAEHVHVGRIPVAAGMARLGDSGPGRHYVSLGRSDGTIVVAERRVPFAGLINFRDIGGYDTEGGGRTRWGLVFRSDSLHYFTAEDLVAFDALGVRAIFDLRRDTERAEAPGPRPFIPLTLPGGRIADADPAALTDRRSGEEWLLEDYLGMLGKAGPVMGNLFTRLAELDAGPAVIHCWGGKDRTGMTVAVLLRLLGVPWQTVLDDYALTASYTPPDRLAEVIELFGSEGIPAAAAEGMLGSPRWVMDEALAVLERDHGGAEAFLTGAGAMTEDAVRRLRSRLVGY